MRLEVGLVYSKRYSPELKECTLSHLLQTLLVDYSLNLQMSV